MSEGAQGFSFWPASLNGWKEKTLSVAVRVTVTALPLRVFLIISLALFLFFSIIMSLSTVDTRMRTVQDRRNSWQFQWRWLKVLLLLACLVISVVFIPSYVIQLYGKAARFRAGPFLLIQLISVIRCITRLSNKWCQTNIENHYLKVIVVSVVAYILSRFSYFAFHLRWSIDVSWTSTWVHIGNEHLAVMSFVAVVITRGYEIGWLQQLLGKIFGIGGEQHENNADAHHTEPEESVADNGSPR